MKKTNAMRLLEAAKINFIIHEYATSDSDYLGSDHDKYPGICDQQIFKTLVARGDKTGITVFCVSIDSELDLKKAAKISGNKKIELVHVKDIYSLTGYIRGGCSPVGIKKTYPTYIDETALLYEVIAISGGMRGVQIIVEPQQLINYINALSANIQC